MCVSRMYLFDYVCVCLPAALTTHCQPAALWTCVRVCLCVWARAQTNVCPGERWVRVYVFWVWTLSIAKKFQIQIEFCLTVPIWMTIVEGNRARRFFCVTFFLWNKLEIKKNSRGILNKYWFDWNSVYIAEHTHAQTNASKQAGTQTRREERATESESKNSSRIFEYTRNMRVLRI